MRDDVDVDEEAPQLLTREQDWIVRQVAEHKSNREIARALGIRPGRVPLELERIYALVGCHDRKSLCHWAAGNRFLPMLSARQTEVARLVAQSYSNKEIAERLYLSMATAKNHVSDILAILQMRSRVELAVWVWQQDHQAVPMPEPQAAVTGVRGFLQRLRPGGGRGSAS